MSKSNHNYQLTKDKIILVELADAELVTEVVGSAQVVKGFKPHRIITHDSQVVASYDRESDKTDISYLLDKEDHFLVTVAAPDREVNEFHWVWWVIGQNMDGEAVHLKHGPVKADANVTALLDKTYPRWRQSSFVDKN